MVEKSYRQSHSATDYASEYDKLYADGYFRQFWHEIEAPILRRELAELQRDGANQILDFACGTGRVTEVVAATFPECIGVDVSEEMLATARRRLHGVRLVQADLTRTDLKQELPLFDAVTAFRFFLNAEDRLRADALDALASHLRPGGILIASFQWAATSPAGFLFRLRNTVKRHEDPRTATVAEISELFARHGFEIERLHRYGAWPWVGQSHGRLGRRGMRSAEALMDRIRPLQYVAQSFMIVARNDVRR